MVFPLPPAVLSICQRLRQQGHDCYVVGGAVRDALLGRPNLDIDLASSASTQEIQHLFRRTVPTGVAHGTVTILEQGCGYEVTTFRVDGPYSDSRRPDQVYPTHDIVQDLARRDFTINAMAYDPLDLRLIDPYQGQQDLQHRVLRCVGCPEIRLREDALRMLRACRFAAQLDFAIDGQLQSAIFALAATIDKVSPPRVTEELWKTLAAPFVARGLGLLYGSGLLAQILPALQLQHNWPFCLQALTASSQNPPLRLALLLHFGLEEGQEAATTLRRLSLSNARRDKTQLLRSQWRRVAALTPICWTEVQLRQLLARIDRLHLADLIEMAGLLQPECQATLGQLAQDCLRVMASGAALSVAALAVNGKQLCQHLGRAPGPWVGQVLLQLLDYVLEQPQRNHTSLLLQWAEQLSTA